jgi:hypothetical protein
MFNKIAWGIFSLLMLIAAIMIGKNFLAPRIDVARLLYRTC